MKLFKLLSQDWAVELRAAQQILIQFARLKSSQPIEGLGGVKELDGEKDTIVAVPLGNGSSAEAGGGSGGRTRRCSWPRT
jgi:hypothetical protein